MLKENPGLKKMLAEISQSEQSKADLKIRHLMRHDPVFLDFADSCLSVVHPKHLSDVITKMAGQE